MRSVVLHLSIGLVIFAPCYAPVLPPELGVFLSVPIVKGKSFARCARVALLCLRLSAEEKIAVVMTTTVFLLEKLDR